MRPRNDSMGLRRKGIGTARVAWQGGGVYRPQGAASRPHDPLPRLRFSPPAGRGVRKIAVVRLCAPKVERQRMFRIVERPRFGALAGRMADREEAGAAA